MSDNQSARRWSLGDRYRYCEELDVDGRPWAEISNLNFNFAKVPVAGYFIKNPKYHASLAQLPDGAFVVEKIHLNDDRQSTEETGVDLLTQLASMPVSFAEIPDYSRVTDLKWRELGDGKRKLECVLTDEQGAEFALKAVFSR